MIDLSIIVVSWNVREQVLDCLETIYQSGGALNVETILVDNASRDGTVAEVHAHYPATIIIQNADNVGFARANNQALANCTGRHILLLNPDTRVLPGALEAMVRVADKDPDIGLVGPQVISPDGSIQLVCGRAFPTVSRWFWYYSFLGQLLPKHRVLGAYYMSYWDHTSSRDVEAICGAAMLIPRRTLEQLGDLDETHPMYLEDVEYCWRAARAGKRIHFAADAVIVHYGGQSSAQVPVRARLMILEAQRQFCRLYGARRSALGFRFIVGFLTFVRLPVLGAVKLASALTAVRHPRIRSISLTSEIVNLLWAIGTLRPPRIQTIR